MLEEIDARLREAERRVARLRHNRRRLNVLNREKQELESRLRPLRDVLEVQRREALAAEGGGFFFLLSSLLEGSDNRVARERAGYQSAKLAFEEVEAVHQQISAQITGLMAENAMLNDAESNLERVREEKIDALETLGHPAADRLVALQVERQRAETVRQEVEEALAAAEPASVSLASLIELVEQIARLGPTLFAAGDRDDRRSLIDDAQRASTEARVRLKAFARELSDVEVLVIDTEGHADFGTLRDAWLDDSEILHVDAMQGHVSRALVDARTALARLQGQRELLRVRRHELDAAMERIDAEEERLLDMSP